MITRLEIDNFKSLHDFKMDLTEFTVIVGNNASGKSTVLQAVAFMIQSVQMDFAQILEQRGWEIEDIKCALLKNTPMIRFSCEMRLQMDGKERTFAWEFRINTKKKIPELSSEKIMDLDTQKVLLEFDSNKLCIFTENGKDRIYPKLILHSSALRIVVDAEKEKELPELVAIKRFFLSSTSYELLSPSDMRQSSRGTTDSIGISGRNLPSFIKSLTDAQKKSFMEKMQNILGAGQIENVAAHTKGKPGWTRIEVTEAYKQNVLKVSSKNMSDGMLRLLAFIAVSEIRAPECMMLLDEIENGINTNYAEKLIKILREAYEEKRHQLIVTTHSTVFVDYVNADDIVFLYRESEYGYTRAAKLFEIPELKEKLEYLYPGEVLLNLSNEEIVNVLLEQRK